MIFLYIKTHNITGLKYLGKTSNPDPYSYMGSGVYWRKHLAKHGYDVSTEIIFESESLDEIAQQGLHYSKLWNIVQSNDWANMIDETGDGVSSEDASAENHRRIEHGTHPFCDPLFNHKTKAKRNQTIRTNQSHNFLGGEIQRRRVDDGTHHLLGGEVQRKLQERRIKNGNHSFLGKVRCIDDDGDIIILPSSEYDPTIHTHVNSLEGMKKQNRSIRKYESFICPHCNKEGKGGAMKLWHFDNCKHK